MNCDRRLKFFPPRKPESTAELENIREEKERRDEDLQSDEPRERPFIRDCNVPGGQLYP